MPMLKGFVNLKPILKGDAGIKQIFKGYTLYLKKLELLTGQTLGNFSVSNTCCPSSRTYTSGNFGDTYIRQIVGRFYYQNNDGFPFSTNAKAYVRLNGGSWVYLGNKNMGDINGGGTALYKTATWTISANDEDGTVLYDQFYLLQEGGGANPKGLNYGRVTEYWI